MYSMGASSSFSFSGGLSTCSFRTVCRSGCHRHDFSFIDEIGTYNVWVEPWWCPIMHWYIVLCHITFKRADRKFHVHLDPRVCNDKKKAM